MSISRIPGKYLDTSISIYGKSQTRDAVGEVTVTKSIKYEDIPAHIQPHDLSTAADIKYELYGVIHYRTHYCYFNRYDDNENERSIEPLDEVLDHTTGKRFSIISIEEKKEFTATRGTHIRLTLEYVAKDSTHTIRRYLAWSKASIFKVLSKAITSKGKIGG